MSLAGSRDAVDCGGAVWPVASFIALTFTIHITRAVIIAVVHVCAHVIGDRLAAAVALGLTAEMALCDVVHHEFHSEVWLRRCNHVSSSWDNNHGEQVVVPVVAANKLSAGVIFVVVGVHLPSLNVKLLPVLKVNALGPFHRLANSIFHVELTHIDQYLETL